MYTLLLRANADAGDARPDAVAVWLKYFDLRLYEHKFPLEKMAALLKYKTSSDVAKIVDMWTRHYGVDFNRPIDGKLLLDVLFSDDMYHTTTSSYTYEAIRAVVRGGARPYLANGKCILIEIIRQKNHPLRGRNSLREASRDMEVLLQHGALVNNVTTAGGVCELQSSILEYLLQSNANGYRKYWLIARIRLLTRVIQHGAFVNSSNAARAIREYVFADFVSGNIPRARLEFILKWFRFAGLSVAKFNLHAAEPITRSSDLWSHDQAVGYDVKAAYVAIEPEPESLQFRCRDVIRHLLMVTQQGRSILSAVDSLPLPSLLQSYLKLGDIPWPYKE